METDGSDSGKIVGLTMTKSGTINLSSSFTGGTIFSSQNWKQQYLSVKNLGLGQTCGTNIRD